MELADILPVRSSSVEMSDIKGKTQEISTTA